MFTRSTFFAASFLLTTLAAPFAYADEPTASPAGATDAEASAPQSPVLSPHAYMHDGFYFREALGLGYSTLSARGPSGSTELRSDIPVFPTANGLALAGGTPFRGLVIGGGFSAMDTNGKLHDGPKDGESVYANQYTVGPFVDWFPDPSKGFHVGALAGASGVLVEGTHAQMSLSLGATVFGGWDFWVGQQTSLGVMAIVSGATPSSLVDTHGNDTGYRVAPVSASLAITFVVH